MKISIIILAVMFLLGSCTVTTPEQELYNTEADFHASRVNEEIVNANTHFALDVLQGLAGEEEQENIFFSPLSLSIALSMTINGAAGTTLEQMQETLHYDDMTLEELNGQNLHLIRSLLDFDPSIELGLANSIWIREEYPVREEFIGLNEEYYLSEIFPDQPFDEQTVIDANLWVSDKTGGRITDLLENLDPLSVLFLLNAIYFSADWKFQFDPNETTEENFKTCSGENVQVPFMKCKGVDFTYISGENYQGVRLPYGNGNIAMYVILPDYGIDLQAMILEQDINSFKDWFSGYEPAPQELQEYSSFSLPTFEVTYEKEYNELLINLGMTNAFIELLAEFCAMVYEPYKPYISYVKQKTWIRTDEEGSEATAATIVMMDEYSIEEFYIFEANRPFVYIIRDDRNGSLLFIGIMDDPSLE